MTPNPRPVLGLAAALVAAVLFSVNGSVSKIVMMTGLSPQRLVELRSVGAALCLLAVVLLTKPKSLRPANRREAVFLVVAGVLGIALVQWLYFVAIGRLPVGVALLLEFQAPVLVALYVRVVRREHVRSRVWAALGLTVVGLIIITEVWEGLSFDVVGVIAGLAAAVALASYYLTGEKALASRDPLSLAAWTFSASAVFWSLLQPWWTFPFDVLTDTAVVPAGGPLAGLELPMPLLLAYIVILGTVLPYVLIYVGVRHLGSARAGLVGMAEPALAGLVAWVVLAEHLSTVQLVGAAVVFGGIVLAETARSPGVSAPSQQVAIGAVADEPSVSDVEIDEASNHRR